MLVICGTFDHGDFPVYERGERPEREFRIKHSRGCALDKRRKARELLPAV
jgi:hypothetical protein